MIKAVFIDIDDTLLDFGKCAEETIRQGFLKYSLPFTQSVIPTFHRINDSLWAKIEAGTLTRPELLKIRWKLVFEALAIDFDGLIFEDYFVSSIYNCYITVDGARELLEYLSKKYKVYAASNALHQQQLARLRSSGLMQYLSGVYTSESVGYQKPTKEFFTACFDDIKEFTPKEAVMIGDSITADIIGGKAMEMKTIFYNHKKISDFDKTIPDFIVNHLSEIQNIL